MLMNAALAVVAVIMDVLIRWEVMSVYVHQERSYTGIKRIVLVSNAAEGALSFFSCQNQFTEILIFSILLSVVLHVWKRGSEERRNWAP